MNINATLVAQAVVFLILAWVTMKFVWPPLINALDERTQKIADGLAAAEKGKAELAIVNKQVEQTLAQAREQGQQRVADAEKRAQTSAEEIKQNAHHEATRIIAQAQSQAEQQLIAARETLRNEVAVLAVKGAEQILRREIDSQAHAALLQQLKAEL